MGPDLTGAATRFGPALPALLQNIPFPAMRPIFENHPLTATERASLASFLGQVAQNRPAGHSLSVGLIGLGGLVAVFLLTYAAWPRRLGSARDVLARRRAGRPT